MNKIKWNLEHLLAGLIGEDACVWLFGRLPPACWYYYRATEEELAHYIKLGLQHD